MILDPDFAVSQKVLYEVQMNRQVLVAHRKTVKYLKGKLLIGSVGLDVGERNPLTDMIEKECLVHLVNTSGDLDTNFKIPINNIYDFVIFSHVIEHLFNPLYTLLRLKEVMLPGAKMYISLPRRTKVLWCRGHFHEIDDYRMRKLLQRSGFKITDKTFHKVWRHWIHYFKGIRPLLRLFFEFYVTYEIETN